jgi:hypothetical protein
LPAEVRHVASDVQPKPEPQKRTERKLAQQYRPIAVPALAAVMPYQGPRKNAAYAPVASRDEERTPSETD